MESIWSKTCDIKLRESLNEDIKTEVLIIGAGLAGILTSYMLKQKGVQIIIVEASRIASGQTKNTTAKITSQHGYIYHNLINNFSREKALMYAKANQLAIGDYVNIIKTHSIDCDFERKDAYLYALENDSLIKKEAEAAKSLGLPASFVRDVNLPFNTVGAVRFENQAQFNPLKFINALANQLTIYENTPIISVKNDIAETKLSKIKAKHIVFACHYPFINVPGYYFARMHQERSYVIALENAAELNGMYIGIEENSLSFRNYGEYLILGNKGHRTGENSKGGQYDTLCQKALKLFPQSRAVTRWSAQDCISADSVPYIGKYSESDEPWYVATGFKKWGMTSSMVAANIISDMIVKKDNPYKEIFSPSRFPASQLKNLATDIGKSIKGITKEALFIPKSTVQSLPVGHGGVIELNGKKVGIYKESDEKFYAVDTKCTHLGCQLEWNPDEKSFDCPCHGSRFDYTGKLIDNPAQSDIETYN